MKLFKKIAAVLSATALIGCACAMSACGSDSVGVINGKYKEATAEEVAQAANGIDESKLLGDMTAKDWKFGLSAEANVDFKLDIPDMVKASATVDADYKITVSKSASALALIPYDVAGMGSFKASVKATAKDQNESKNLNVKLYNDSSNVYIAMDDLNGKLSLEYVMEYLEDILDGIGDNLPEVGDMPDLGDFELSDLESLGVKTYLDTSNGTKIKVSATQDTFVALAKAAGYGEEVVSFSKASLDVYFAVDKDGAFLGMGVNFNIALSAKVTANSTATFSLKGGFGVKAYNGTVKLPDDLDGYTDLSKSLGGIGGILG